MTLPSTEIEELSVPYQALRLGMLGFLRKHVNDPMAAEDLLHEVFLKALSAGKKGATPKNLTGWLYKVARNTVIDYYRTKRPSEQLPDLLMAEDSTDHSMTQALAGCLKPLTEQLPPLYRDVLVATEFEGKPLQDLATEWQVSLSAVKSRASRGRALLKDKVFACCQIELSKSGALVDFEKRPSTDDCDGSASCSPACS
jgi:RNA polymerase sigma-70 factor, ECF subfamily